MKKLLLIIFAISVICPVYAQRKDKVQTDQVGQLVSAENYFVSILKEKGTKKAFLAVSDENTILFRPGPVSAEDFFKDRSDTSRGLSWEPVYAKISKSGDWGFTTGPYIYKAPATGKESYGDYCSVWKKNSKGVWKLAIDLGVPHPKPEMAVKLTFINPATDKFMRQTSDARLKQREEIVFNSDKLFATTLKANTRVGLEEFIADDCRLLLPGFEPILGSNAINDFFDTRKIKLSSVPVHADRALSGELAFTYGDAAMVQNGETKNYHYVRIWSVQAGYVWKVIVDVYTEAL